MTVALASTAHAQAEHAGKERAAPSAEPPALPAAPGPAPAPPAAPAPPPDALVPPDAPGETAEEPAAPTLPAAEPTPQAPAPDGTTTVVVTERERAALEEWRRQRASEELDEAARDAEEDAAEDAAEAQAAAERSQRRQRFRGLVYGGAGLTVGIFSNTPNEESSLRFELGAGVQQHFAPHVGYQLRLGVGLGGVVRRNLLTEDERSSILTALLDVSNEGVLLFGPYGRFTFGAGYWLAAGGYVDNRVSVREDGARATTEFPSTDNPGDAVVFVGPNALFSVALGSEHSMAVGVRVQPGGAIGASSDGMFRVAAVFDLLLP